MTSPRLRPTRPCIPYLMSASPSSRVPRSQVPTHASRCPRPLVPIPLLYTAYKCYSFPVTAVLLSTHTLINIPTAHLAKSILIDFWMLFQHKTNFRQGSLSSSLIRVYKSRNLVGLEFHHVLMEFQFLIKKKKGRTFLQTFQVRIQVLWCKKNTALHKKVHILDWKLMAHDRLSPLDPCPHDAVGERSALKPSLLFLILYPA